MKIYKDIVLSQVPRILGLGDRNEQSKTFGCFDRYYWHYKLTDFSNARFQESCLLLALLYKNDFPDNIYYNKTKMLDWSKAAIRFWLQIQHRDGSVDEAYPYERSFCATAMSCYSATEAILILNYRIGPSGLIKTGKWLSKNNNMEVSNQIAAASLALYNIYLITKRPEFSKAAKEKMNSIIRHQHSYGYYPEYGGSDIGYHTLTTSLVAQYYRKSQDKDVLESLKKAFRYADKQIRNNGSYDNSNSGRQTQFLYPLGFQLLGKDIENKIIDNHRKVLKKNIILNPAWMDDRYVTPLATDYLMTYLDNAGSKEN